MKRLRTVLIGLALLLALAACEGGSHRQAGTLPSPMPPALTKALATWQAFPAARSPRPIIALGQVTGGNVSFPGLDSKIRLVCGRFAPLANALPGDQPPRATVTLPGGMTETFPALSASAAYAALSSPANADQDHTCAGVAPIQVTSARLGSAALATDRGQAQVTSWLFTIQGAAGELSYPALPPTAYWGGGPTQRGFAGARLGPDGRSGTYGFIGAQEGDAPCQMHAYRAVVAESGSAVAVIPQGVPSPEQARAGIVACPLIGYVRSTKFELTHPLGGRVMVDDRALPVTVTPR